MAPPAFIAKLLRKSPYEGRTRWDRVRSSYGDFLNSFAMKARVRCELKQLCCNCYINPDFSVKMSDVSEHSKFCYPEKKREKRSGHMI